MSQQLRDQRGFTLMELLVASTCTVLVLGGAVAIASQIQEGYRRQIEDSAGEQEARYALDWIGKHLRSVGNNPFNVSNSNCPAANTLFQGLIPGNTSASITLQSDSNPPDGQIGGTSPACNQAGEHVTISFNQNQRTIEFLDNAVGANATTRTDNVIDNLAFTYLNSDRSPWDSSGSANNIFYVQTSITIRTRTVNAATGQPATRTLMSEIRVRSR